MGSTSAVSLAGPGQDCNGNGVPDEEDLENCTGDPACDDCNLNDVLDGCDITESTSNDENLDGVPDECVFFDDGGEDDDWSTPGNWDDDEVPNNLDMVDDESVTIDANGVNLDMEVEVDTLRLLDGATLYVVGVTQEDFEVEESGGILIASEAAGQSRLLVGEGRTIGVVPGMVHIGSGGVYAAAGGGTAAAVETCSVGEGVQAVLEAGNILVDSRCGEPIPGKMILNGRMVTAVSGDLVIDATQDCVVCALCNAATQGSQANILGGETPPVLCVADSAVLQIGGNLALHGAVSFSHTSSVAIQVGGDFLNHSTCPECIQLSGTIVFGSSNTSTETAGAGGVPRQFEVAGRDLGPTPDGFNANFAIGTLEVASGVVLHFTDAFSNSGSGGTEAAYVDTLILRASATIVLADARVYYHTLIDEGASIDLTGKGSLVAMAGGAIPTVSTWGLAAMGLFLLTLGTLVIRSPRLDSRVSSPR